MKGLKIFRDSKVSSDTLKVDSINKQYKNSYSQSGEDLIIDYVLTNHFHVHRPTYLDIGAYDPIKLSNTYLLYERGGKGVLIEPDPDLATSIRKIRPRDIVLNVGISDKKSMEDFYLVDPPTLNTFSKNEYDQYTSFYPGTSLRKIVKIPTTPVTEIIGKYFPKGVDLLSVDVEGLDYRIVSSLDFGSVRPKIICIESVKYEDGNTWVKPTDISKLLIKKSYFLYADTFINSIYVDKKAWAKNQQPKLKNFEGR